MENDTKIIRYRSADPFCRIPNATLQDKRLTWEAKGILAYLLSKPDHWVAQTSDIVNNGAGGPDKVRAALIDLRQNGYAELRKYAKAGKVVRWLLSIADSPVFTSEGRQVNIPIQSEADIPDQNRQLPDPVKVTLPDVDFPVLAKPDQAEPEKENTHFSNTEGSNTELSKTHTPGEARPRPADATEAPPKFNPSTLTTAWNEMTDGLLAAVVSLNEGRKKSIRTRLRDPFFAANWRKAIARMLDSDFCLGKVERPGKDTQWVATFDWFIKPNKCAKIMEGAYDNDRGNKQGKETDYGNKDSF